MSCLMLIIVGSVAFASQSHGRSVGGASLPAGVAASTPNGATAVASKTLADAFPIHHLLGIEAMGLPSWRVPPALRSSQASGTFVAARGGVEASPAYGDDGK